MPFNHLHVPGAWRYPGRPELASASPSAQSSGPPIQLSKLHPHSDCFLDSCASCAAVLVIERVAPAEVQKLGEVAVEADPLAAVFDHKRGVMGICDELAAGLGLAAESFEDRPVGFGWVEAAGVGPRQEPVGGLEGDLQGRGDKALPFCYHVGMSKQIAVRLPEDLVTFVDEVVGSGAERSRAAVVTRALERERRRALAERDARILARTGPDPEFAGLAEYAARLPRDLA